jgi:hypothetical protein
MAKPVPDLIAEDAFILRLALLAFPAANADKMSHSHGRSCNPSRFLPNAHSP